MNFDFPTILVAATFITGQEICVDGGLTAGLGNPLLGAASAAG